MNMNELDEIILSEKGQQLSSKKQKMIYQPIINTNIKTKLRIKLEAHSNLIDKKLKSNNDKEKNVFQIKNNKFMNNKLNNLVNVENKMVTDIFINKKTDNKNNNCNPINLKNIKNKKSINININNKKIAKLNKVQRKIKKKSKKKIKQFSVKELNDVHDIKYNIKRNDYICETCKQTLDNQLILYSGKPQHGFDEELANIDARLLIVNQNYQNTVEDGNTILNKITDFSIYCKNGHLYPFNYESIEMNVELYFSGYVKPIQSDNPAIENGVPGKNFGPIKHMRIKSFVKKNQPIICIKTQIGDYILMEPSKEYAPFMKSFIIKIAISKVVIEYLVYEPNATYEDLLYTIQNTPSINNLLPNFTEDTLMSYASFICEQVVLFDQEAKPWQPLLVLASCIRHLLDLSGSTLFDRTQTWQNGYWKYLEENYREILIEKACRDRTNHSATQQLINRLLHIKGNVLNAKLENGCQNKCGICKLCQWPLSKVCTACNKRKNILYLQRCCLNRQIQLANYEDVKNNGNLSQNEIENSINVYKNNIKIFSCFRSKLSWLGKPIAQESEKIYYNSIKIDDEIINVNDFVYIYSVNASIPAQIVKVAYMWEEKSGILRFHANYLWSQRDTVLGNLFDSKELFDINKCCNLAMSCVVKKAKVYRRIPPTSQVDTGIIEFNQDLSEYSFFYQKCYDPVSGYFRDLQFNNEISKSTAEISHQFCYNCEVVRLQNERNTPRLFHKLEENDICVTYRTVMYKDEEYSVGSCVYLKPESLYYKYPKSNNNVKLYNYIIEDINDQKYPEYYRKFEDLGINSKLCSPKPFDIGLIIQIFTVENKLFIKVKKLYRPENTHKGDISYQCDLNMLFYSNEECTVPFINVINKCYVTYAKNLKNLYEWLNKGPDRFYFTRMYEINQFYRIDKRMYNCKSSILEIARDYPVVKTLKTLDLFAGCGGLSLGLIQAGVSKICWAIENNILTAKTYKLNNPDTVVFVEHANNIFKLIMEGEMCINNQLLPAHQDVEFICASLPCKNYRNLNISSFKNSSVATFISYCEYYKPLLFLLEADEEFIKNNTVLKLSLACFVSLGYQVSFDLLQVGSYGAPQNRTRSVILGAAPGQILPKFPRHLHVFPKSYCKSEIIIDDKKYTQENNWIESAPYKTVTVRDALHDLPIIKSGDNKRIINYNGKPIYYYQKMMRLNMHEPILYDHICKDLDPIIQARIIQIPMATGSDWRNIPNIEFQLNDGSIMKRLIYDDKRRNKKNNDLDDVAMGTCSCPIGKICYLFRNGQETSLIPWYLVHSGSKNKYWPGLYSRLSWDGFFTNTSTNPELLSKQGPIIHPTQPRFVSVREYARSQGFPDNYMFSEDASIQDKYCQIGSAVSPLLALAIGREIARSLDLKKK